MSNLPNPKLPNPIPGADQEGHPNPPTPVWAITLGVIILLIVVVAIYVLFVRHRSPAPTDKAASIHLMDGARTHRGVCM